MRHKKFEKDFQGPATWQVAPASPWPVPPLWLKALLACRVCPAKPLLRHRSPVDLHRSRCGSAETAGRVAPGLVPWPPLNVRLRLLLPTPKRKMDFSVVRVLTKVFGTKLFASQVGPSLRNHACEGSMVQHNHGTCENAAEQNDPIWAPRIVIFHIHGFRQNQWRAGLPGVQWLGTLWPRLSLHCTSSVQAPDILRLLLELLLPRSLGTADQGYFLLVFAPLHVWRSIFMCVGATCAGSSSTTCMHQWLLVGKYLPNQSFKKWFFGTTHKKMFCPFRSHATNKISLVKLVISCFS